MNSTPRQIAHLKHLKNIYQDFPIWIAIDYYGQPVTFAGLIETDAKVDYANAKVFIYSQLVKMDSISAFTSYIGRDGEKFAFLKEMVQNDRNMSFWINLAKKWFNAEWQGGYIHEQL